MAKRKAEEKREETLTISLSLGEFDETAYAQQHVDVQLDRRQSVALKRLLAWLHSKHASLASGRHVETPPDAIRWLLEEIAFEGKVR